MSKRVLVYKALGDVDVSDKFFDSLRDGYVGFDKWFASKAAEKAYILEDSITNAVQGMLYIKIEEGPIQDIEPNLGPGKWLKVGTLKINAAGTKAGERVIKKAFDHAVAEECVGVYVTVFAKHKELIKLLERYGFVLRGQKDSVSGVECVFVKDLQTDHADIRLNYPRLSLGGRKCWLLAIYPEYHTRLLPDSKLVTDPVDTVSDVSHTNTIEKIYVGKVALSRVNAGDIVVMYRTCDKKGPAYFRSVATSVCVAVESKRKKDFGNEAEFIAYCKKHSVFEKSELKTAYRTSARTSTLRMLYNAAFERRIIRKFLLEDVLISEQPRWDLKELSEGQARRLLELAEVPDGIIID
ncbi:MAG: hypothetical protein ACSHWZ_17685 [Sulfitobacter sp.]|uniref:hypothetical protein n=1 Tax=Celeribacter marinus TaxID=1397108 RepID=UPI00317C507C